MKKLFLAISMIFACAAASLGANASKASGASDLTMRYDRPASYWVEALPLGNGRLGAMVYGGIPQDTIQLNEDTFWSGSPYNNYNINAKAHLQEIRDAINRGDYIRAQKLSMRNITADKELTAHGMIYESVGNLLLTFPESHRNASGYSRELDLSKAVATTRYTVGGVDYVREVITSLADDVTLIRLTASRKGALDFTVGFAGPQKRQRVVCETEIVPGSDNTLRVRSLPGKPEEENIPNKLAATTYIRVLAEGGTQSADRADTTLVVNGANAATIIVSSATNFVNYRDISGDADAKALALLDKFSKKYSRAKADHSAIYGRQFNRVSFDLGINPEQAAKPTDVRIAEYASSDDPSLTTMYFQFGRYLLISSSQPGTQPANLQGIWNPDAGQYPAWDSKYTTNINVEMNYWPAEVTNLSECHDPFLQLVRDVSVTGRESAEKMYGARGWTLHHNTDLWRSTGAVDYASCSVWPTCNAWFASHLWERYLYSGDKEYLASVYPILKSACEFYLDFLTTDPETGYMVASPSNSPENHPGIASYTTYEGKKQSCAIFSGVTMDNQMIYDLMRNTILAARTLDTDSTFAAEVAAVQAKLPPMQVGQYGQIQEWLKDWDRENTGHRHISHLWGLYPGNQISAYENPDLFRAAGKSLIGRGDASRGWSMGWKVCLWPACSTATMPCSSSATSSCSKTPTSPSATPTAAPTLTCLTHIPRSRSTATSVAPQAWPKCSSRATTAPSTSSPHSPTHGPRQHQRPPHPWRLRDPRPEVERRPSRLCHHPQQPRRQPPPPLRHPPRTQRWQTPCSRTGQEPQPPHADLRSPRPRHQRPRQNPRPPHPRHQPLRPPHHPRSDRHDSPRQLIPLPTTRARSRYPGSGLHYIPLIRPLSPIRPILLSLMTLSTLKSLLTFPTLMSLTPADSPP